MPNKSKNRRYVYDKSVDKEKKKIEKIFEGTSPLWIRIIIFILRAWFYIYDCLNYIPYELFNSPTAKLQRSNRIKAKPEKGLDSPWVNVEGPIDANIDGNDTVDKVFTYIAKKFGDKTALGTRELIDVTEQVQPDGRVFEKWELGEYQWESYEEVLDRIGMIAAGLNSIVDGQENKVRGQMQKSHKEENEITVESRASKDDIAMIMYTSGTTGAPKGVLITNENIVASAIGLAEGVPIVSSTDTYIGYLPLAHILEVAAELTCLVSELIGCYCNFVISLRGCRIGYSSPLTLHDRGAKIKPGTHGDCWALRPTVMAAVPAIMDRIFKAVSDEVASSPRLMQELFKLNYERKRARYEEGYCSPFLDRIVFKKIRRLLGGKLRGVMSGGAALNPETQRFMNICMCCPVIQGYG
ncbi:unnamed protein product, partial [Anisakis simplex]|uniref:long-chain-fatty-acid--CoA ligase n=1 Tax=Anisakis simplex TaxID=6269 RepID=A0A0M3KB74_ANISI